MAGVAAAALGRRARLFGISVLGQHIGRNYVNLVDKALLTKQAEEVVQATRERLADVYSVRCQACSRTAELVKTIWSYQVACSGCGRPVSYYRAMEAAGWSKHAMKCPGCGTGVASRDRRVREGLMTAPGQYTRELAAQAHGPHDDQATADAARLAAETIRYLNYATMQGGLTQPATIYTITAELSAAVYRLPQLLTQIADWLTAETAAGRIGDDHQRSAGQLTDSTRTVLGQATEHAERLARALAAAQTVTSTLHATTPGDRRHA